MKIVWIGVAGFAGAISRYALSGFVADRSKGPFPWGTFVVNVAGCFALGLVFALLTERYLSHPTLRAALTIGFLGAYTTFSTFAFETMRLIDDGAVLLAGANVLGSVAAGITAIYIGTWLGRAL